MPVTTHPFALNPIQWLASDDGWLDFSRQLDHRQLLEEIKAAGFDAVMAELPDGWSLEQYQAVFQEIGLECAPGFFSVGLAEQPDNELVARAAAVARTHADLGLKEIFLGTGMSRDAPRVLHPAQGFAFDQGRLERVIELIETVARTMIAEGVRPALHPHVGTWIETEDEARTVLEAIDSSLLAFGPDTGHLVWAGADVRALISDYADRVASVHVKDCRLSVAERARSEDLGYQAAVMAGLWAEPGRGELELEAILDALPTTFDGWLIVEVDRPDLADPLESARASASWMKRYIQREPVADRMPGG
jgi:inosose dehydratase